MALTPIAPGEFAPPISLGAESAVTISKPNSLEPAGGISGQGVWKGQGEWSAVSVDAIEPPKDLNPVSAGAVTAPRNITAGDVVEIGAPVSINPIAQTPFPSPAP